MLSVISLLLTPLGQFHLPPVAGIAKLIRQPNQVHRRQIAIHAIRCAPARHALTNPCEPNVSVSWTVPKMNITRLCAPGFTARRQIRPATRGTATAHTQPPRYLVDVCCRIAVSRKWMGRTTCAPGAGVGMTANVGFPCPRLKYHPNQCPPLSCRALSLFPIRITGRVANLFALCVALFSTKLFRLGTL
jgi:hypothetical protein